MMILPEEAGRDVLSLSCADNLFEEIEPMAILKARKNENGTRDFLVKWSDGAEDSWVRMLLHYLTDTCRCSKLH